jgi:hypothetical protein
MSVYSWVILNAALSTLVVVGIVGLFVWSVLTQHRHPGRDNVRLRFPRPRIWISLAELEARAAREIPQPQLSLPWS